jgi:hypothetical protein
MEPPSIADYLRFIAEGAVEGAIVGCYAALPFVWDPPEYAEGIFVLESYSVQQSVTKS